MPGAGNAGALRVCAPSAGLPSSPHLDGRRGAGCGWPSWCGLEITHIPGLGVVDARSGARAAAGFRWALGPALRDKEPAWGRGRGEATALAPHPLHLLPPHT